MKKRQFFIQSVIIFILALCFFTACDSGGGDREIPDKVLAATAEMFDFVDMVLSLDGDYTEMQGIGMTVSQTGIWGSYPYTITLTGEDIDPDGEESDVIIEDFDFSLHMDDNPYLMEINWDAIADNWLYSSSSLEGTVKWLTGTPDENPPDDISGSVTLDGAGYDLEEVFNAMMDAGYFDDKEEEKQ